MAHKQADGYCERCRMTTFAYIPHEHDPSICPNCNGRGKIKVVLSNHEHQLKRCKRCSGTGRLTFV